MYPLNLVIPTVAITGSAGKTTTRELVAAILATKMNVLKSNNNRNSPYATKVNANRITPDHDAVVLEFAMGRKNRGIKHCRHIIPNMSIITNIGYAHFHYLGNNIEQTAKNKSELITYMHPQGTLFLNNDDEHSSHLQTEGFKGKVITVGINNKADYQASEVKFEENGMSFKVIIDEQIEQFSIPIFGVHNVINSLFAIAVAHQLKFTAAEIREGLMQYRSLRRRLNPIQLQNESLLIDDSFSSNPQAAKGAIDVLSELGKEKKKIAVMGSMLELGTYSIEGHNEVGRYLHEKGIDEIYTLGIAAKQIGHGAIEVGYPETKVFCLEDRTELHTLLAKSITSNTVVLVKGSNKTRMNRTVRYLLKKFR